MSKLVLGPNLTGQKNGPWTHAGLFAIERSYSASGELLQCAGHHDTLEQTDRITCTASAGNIPLKVDWLLVMCKPVRSMD